MSRPKYKYYWTKFIINCLRDYDVLHTSPSLLEIKTAIDQAFNVTVKRPDGTGFKSTQFINRVYILGEILFKKCGK